MSTRGPRRWCPDCNGQVYFHHRDDDADEDVYYCQGCGKEHHDTATLTQPKEQS